VIEHATAQATLPGPVAVTSRAVRGAILRALLGLSLLLTGCLRHASAGGPGEAIETAAQAGAEAGRKTLVMISFDGFRWDYPELHGAPTLLRLAGEGVRAESLVPSFPSKTYPNHYTLATGLRPEHHGIVANTMWDEDWSATFSLADRAQVEDGRWWEGEPIWVTAERQGRIAAASFWPGSEAAIGGARPTFWARYDAAVPDSQRVDAALGWLDLPLERRPSLLLLYFAEPDSSGHRFGPGSPETGAAVARLDRLLAHFVAGLDARGLEAAVDLIVVSDHGMTEVAPERSIVLEDHLDLRRVRVLDPSTFALLIPEQGYLEQALAALRSAHPHLHAERREAMPERLHYRAHRRISPLVVWADPGWLVYATRADRDAARAASSVGAHGYDPESRDMHGLLVARGPSFRSHLRVPPVENVDVYELMCAVIGLAPARNDGDFVRIAPLLARPVVERAARQR
jgi:predicted AlkP superfamily pyrophosphatase or phosphodiesterase